MGRVGGVRAVCAWGEFGPSINLNDSTLVSVQLQELLVPQDH